MNPIHILYDSQMFDLQKFGGISRYFCEIIPRLHLDYTISVRYTENYYLSHSKLSKYYLPIPHFFFKKYSELLYRQNHKLTKKLLEQPTPYIFHPTYYDPYFLNHIGSHPYVITVHDMIYELFPHYFPDSEEIIAAKKEIITKATRIIAISENTKKDIIKLLNINPQKIDVIYHGTNMQAIGQQNKLYLPEKYILFVGDRVTYKNFLNLLRAFSSISQTNPHLFLICTGKPLERNELQLMEELKVRDKVVQMSVNDQLLCELYRRALVFVYPSLYEGFGIPILEAFACQCPIALSQASCFPEIAEKAAAYFDPYSVESIANTLLQVIKDKETRTQLIAAGKKRLYLYSWDKAAQQTEEVYNKIMIEKYPQTL